MIFFYKDEKGAAECLGVPGKITASAEWTKKKDPDSKLQIAKINVPWKFDLL